MKHHVFNLATVLALTSSLVSCTDKTETQDWGKPVSKDISIKVTTSAPEQESVIWADSDKLGLFCSQTGHSNAAIAISASSIGSSEGIFYPDIKIEDGSILDFFIYYPYSEGAVETALTGTLPKTLNQSGQSDSHLKKINLFTGTGKYEGGENTEVEIELKSLLRKHSISISSTKYADCPLDRILIKTSSGNAVSGKWSYNTQSGEVSFTEPSDELTINVSGIVLSETAESVYYLMIPLNEFNENASLEVSITKGEGNVLLTGTADLSKETTINLDSFKSSEIEDNSINLADPDADGVLETANCYIAGAAGTQYRFPATVMGNGYTTAPDQSYTVSDGVKGSSPGIIPSALAPMSAKILWQTEPSLLNNVSVKNGYIYFNTNGEENGTLRCGNALIAAYSSEDATGEILWSWHIWITDADLDSKLQTWTIHKDFAEYDAYKDPQLMDRNLGALSERGWEVNENNLDHGLYYQWGRKDPFVGADDSQWGSTTTRKTYDCNDNEIKIATEPSTAYSSDCKWTYVNKIHLKREDLGKYPMAFYYSGTTKSDQFWMEEICHDLWGCPAYADDSNKLGHKTIYDPCPPGYRVMNPYAMTGAAPKSTGGKYADMTEGLNVINYSNYATNKEALQVRCNENEIAYIPATGLMKFEANPYAPFRTGSYGYIWTTKMTSGYTSNAYRLHFDTANFNTMGGRGYVSYGHSVRCEKIK